MVPGNHGLVRVAAGCPPLHLADPARNADEILLMMKQAGEQGACVLVLPEMALTGYTCSDLFFQQVLLDASETALSRLLAAQAARDVSPDLIVVVGLPVQVRGRLYNCAAVLQGGQLLGIIPKTYLPNYSEFYDRRFFVSALEYTGPAQVPFLGITVPFSPNLVFRAPNQPEFVLGVEICEDAWAPIPRCSILAAAGASVIANLSASNELIGKAEYRRDVVVKGHSASGLCAYIYASAGPGESTTDTVFGGHCLIAENGSILGESDRFVLGRPTLLVQDIDVQRLAVERRRMNTFGECQPGLEITTIVLGPIRGLLQPDLPLQRWINPTPFVPSAREDRRHRCEEIFRIQTTALARRSSQLGHPKFVVGVSGGLDSTLALLVCHKTLQLLDRSPQDLVAITMPGFGTTDRTRQNAIDLSQALTGLPPLEIDIRPACRQHLADIQHPAHLALSQGDMPETGLMNVAFENVQARERTQILMDLANQVGGLVIGTGDLSEMALGWSTYNGDHMSMYAVNCGIPKTLIQYVVGWAADIEFAGETGRVLHDVLATPISPELLPAVKGQISQETESIIGPYVLHDFFLFHTVRGAAAPAKIVLLAKQAFQDNYTEDEIRRWLGVFLRRFFSNQFKRSCVPDGPKVGTVSLSPRADWRMPSDATVQAWLDSLESVPVTPYPDDAIAPGSNMGQPS